MPVNLKIVLDFFWVWFYMRYFMRWKSITAPQSVQIGDMSPQFSLATFLPERVRPAVNAISEMTFAIFNMCGIINFIRRKMDVKANKAKPKFSSETTNNGTYDKNNGDIEQKDEPMQRTNSFERKKAALDFLDKEI